MMRQDLPNLKISRALVVLDAETTGFYPDSGDEIIELAAEKLIDRQVVDTFHAFIAPSRPVPPDALAIHGLDNIFLEKHGEEAANVFPRFAAFIEEAVLVGHNIRRFDYCFLAAHFARLNLPLPANDILDTLDLARAALLLPNYKLATVAAHFDISTAGAHRAMADVIMAREVLLRLWPN